MEREKLHKEEKEAAGHDPAASASGAMPGSEGMAEMPEQGESNLVGFTQLTLFPTVTGQMERIARAQEAAQSETGHASFGYLVPRTPEDVIDSALTCGGSEENSILRIIAFFQKSPEDAEAAAFLEKEYGTWGRGISLAGKEYALWHDEAGIHIAPGRSARIPGSTLIPWREAGMRIRRLLREGRYASQEKLDGAWENRCLELAKNMWYMKHDISDEAGEKGFLPYLSSLCGGGFPKDTERIAEALQEEEGKAAFAAELGEFAHAYEADRSLMRFRLHNPVRVEGELSGLGIRQEQFRAAEGFEAVKEGFITEDEADSILAAGLKAIDKKMEIYSCFMQGNGQGKCAAILRRTYRDAGATRHARCEISYDNKGMRIAAKDDLSGQGGYVTLQLDWKEVEERVRRLTGAGKYLSPEELAYAPEYEKKQLARQVYDFYFHDPNAPRKGERTWDAGAAERDYLPMLKNPKYKVVLYRDMAETFAAVPAEDKDSYQTMKAAMDAMGVFIRGEYSLFTPQPKTVAPKGRKNHSPAKKAPGEETITGTTKGAGTDRSTEGEKAERTTARGQGKREPARELEAAARALARKQKRGTREETDGQLSFDFGNIDIPGAEAAADQGKEAEKAPGSYVEVLQDKMPGMEPGTVPQKAPASLYRETLTELTRQVMNGGYIAYLRDRDISYDDAVKELDEELDHFISEIQDSQPELYHAFQTLPKFRGWMVEDILERTYRDVVTAPGDAVARHAGDPDAPEWVREAVLSDLEEAKQLIDSFCREEYGAEPMDFDNLEQLGLAWTVIEDEKHEIEVLTEANLLEPSISRFVDGICVERREYGSLRELIDKELCTLDYVELLRLDHIAPEVLLEAGIPEEQLPEVMGLTWQEINRLQAGEIGNAGQEETATPEVSGLPGTAQQGEQGYNQQDSAASGVVEIEGGQIVTAGPMEVYRTGLPYDIAIQKLHFGPELHNFRITDEALGTGEQKAKYQNNLAAIRTLKQVEAENRMASPEEQETLSRYVGWGGLAQAFDPANEKWAKEYTELKEALTPEEYESARGSVLNAHYTSPTVIGAVYEALGRMDFIPGNILEPSCGIGNFFGLLPEKYDGSSLYGVELDSLTGRIAGQLYQKAGITVKGFEHTEFPDDFFDLAIGNVPFGEYKVHDRRYDRQNLLIHDYFLTKALDKVRPGGIMAFLTSKGTMDKANENVREDLARKADLLGAIRLPNNAFLGNAGTSVTADILFFQKRGSAPEKMPDWVHTGQTEAGIPMNRYFLQHPELVLGKMEFARNMYGNETETACLPFEGADLEELLEEAVGGIAPPDRKLLLMDAPGQTGQEGTEDIPADPDVRNFSFTEKNGRFYFRENSRMKQVELKGMPAARVRGMIGIRDSARRLIDLQLNGAGDAEIEKEQANLNVLYDDFQKRYGLINSAGNRQAFRQDVSYPLLSSLEVLDGEGNFKCKADMFSRRTIFHRSPVNSVDTAVEALGVSIGERACVDLGFMASLMGGSEKIPQIVSDLKGIIFKDPATGPFDPGMQDDSWYKGWQAADEYLSGNVRRKLERARAAAENHPGFAVNAEALEKVQPKDLSAAEISVRIGAPWVDTKYYRQFLFELLQIPEKLRRGKVDVLYAESTGEWKVKKDGAVSTTDARVWNTYGTKRMNAYEIFENTLNQRSVQIFDYKVAEDGRDIRVVNEKETAIAQQKQEAMKDAFQDWIFRDPERRKDLCGTYNRLFNSTRPREYDGQHIIFSGMNPEIRLEAHQKNAVARILYGGNTLLAHVVGAGKTYEMVAAAMEGKRLGLCRKSMIVVPNHLTEQWGSEFLTLYPGAKVLVATKKDFEPKNRKRFCARIATGDFDAVIIGHSQFEKIPLSSKRQEALIRAQIEEVLDDIEEAKAEKSERFTIKQMERTKKSLEARLERLYDKKKDDTVTFEELGIDRLFVDEAHSFKNRAKRCRTREV